MGEESKGIDGSRPEPVATGTPVTKEIKSVERFIDPRLVRTIQRTEPMSPDAFKKAFNDDVKESIGEDGKIDIDMFDFVEQYTSVVGEPYSAKYFRAEEILNDLTREDFETIDEYILKELKDTKKKTSFEIFDNRLGELETLLGLDKDNETMHRILKTVKFIKASKDGSRRN